MEDNSQKQVEDVAPDAPPSDEAQAYAQANDDVAVEDVQADDAKSTRSLPELTPQQAAATVEAILFAADSPLTPARIAQVARLSGQKAVKEAIKALNETYEQTARAFRIESVAGGYQMLTLPEYHDVLARLFRARGETKLSPAAMETLAMVAYRQPVLRADIEAIRGVASGELLRSLMERQMVKIVGRAEVLGRPMLYGTTKKFLEVFGLGSLEDLPRVEELRAGAKPTPTAPATTPAPVAEPEPASAPVGQDGAEQQAIADPSPTEQPLPQADQPIAD